MPLFNVGARAGGERVHDRVLTVPNLITTIRLAGLPLFAWLVLGPERLFLAFCVLAVIAMTDWIDGYIARRFDQVTRIGKLVDPLVDRMLLATAVITLLIADLVPWPLVALILVRDILVLGASLVWFGGVPPIAVSNTGKLATALLMIGVPGFLLAGIDWPGSAVVSAGAWISTIAGITAYYVAGYRYGRVALAIRRARTD